MAEEWEFVRGSKKPTQVRKPYFRRRSQHRKHPTTDAMRMVQYQFGRAARTAKDKTGKVDVNGKLLPPACRPVAELKGTRFSLKSNRVPPFLKDLEPALISIAEAIPSFRSLNRDILPRFVLAATEEKKELLKALQARSPVS